MASDRHRPRLIRAVMVVLPIVVVDIVIMGSLVAIVATSALEPIPILIACLAIAALMIGPVVLGSIRAYWRSGTSSDGPRMLRRTRVTMWGVSAAAAITLIVVADAGRLNVVAVAVVIVVSLLLGAVAEPYGAALRRQESTLRRDSSSVDADAMAYDGTTVRVCMITFAVAGLICVIADLLLAVVFGAHDPSRWVALILPSASLVLLATAAPIVIRSLPIGRSLRDALDGDLGRARRVSRAITRGRLDELSDEDGTAARTWAPRFLRYQRYVFAWTALLYAALCLQQIAGLVRGGDTAWISGGGLALLAVAMIAVLPIARRRARRVASWAALHPPGPDQPGPVAGAV